MTPEANPAGINTGGGGGSGSHHHQQFYTYGDNTDPYGQQDQNQNQYHGGGGMNPAPPPRAPTAPPRPPSRGGSPNNYHRSGGVGGMGVGAIPSPASAYRVGGGLAGHEQQPFAEDNEYYEFPVDATPEMIPPHPQQPSNPPMYQMPYQQQQQSYPQQQSQPTAPLQHPFQEPMNPYEQGPYENNLYQNPPYESQFNILPQPNAYVNEDPESYLLKPYPQPHQHALGMSNNDDSYSSYVGDDQDDFHPFPVMGDQYALNTWDDDETEFSDSTPEDDNYSFQGEQAVPPAGVISGVAPIPLEELPLSGEPIPPPPDMQPRRAKTMKRVRLYRGNLVLDCPVSTKLLSQFSDPNEIQREFTHMRYSAATCDPHDFKSSQFTLRQTCYHVPRQTELFIVVTIYNEDDILLGRTLQGVFRNIRHLVNRTRSKTWGKDSWKKVVVCVVADGRDQINPRAKALMAALGVYQDGFAKNIVNDRPVQAHIYEYTTRVGISHVDSTVKLTTEKTVPVQMVFCLKEKNQKKINSHRWFFQAFGSILNPNICVLLDAGTQPGHDSIYHLWKTFDVNRTVGGACGEITAGLGPGWRNLLNPLVAAQNFEYKMSNILDKPLESVFGFISVLPGAFSAYRYEALQNDINGSGPLEKYFKGETLHDSGAGIFTANMYLAEDRILCYELVAKRNANWLLKYVKSAHAETDVPDHLAELVLQRRRWLNGSFFAAMYAQVHMFSIWRSGHSIFRKLFLHVEFLYQLVSMLFSWFSIGNYFLVFRILTSSLADASLGFVPGKILSVIFLWIYCGCLVTIFVLSFGNRPTGTYWFYVIIVSFFALLMAYLMFAAIYISVKSVEFAICANGGFSVSLVLSNQTFRDLVISIVSTYALYFISSFLFFEPWHMFTSFLQYLLVSPSYINVLNVYAFCNIHDISWGTKGDTEQKMDLGVAKTNTAGKLEVDIPTHTADIDSSYLNQIVTLAEPAKKVKKERSVDDKNIDYYALFRSSVVLSWIFTNVALVAVVLNTAGLNVFDNSTSTTSANSNTLLKRSELLVRAAAANCGSIGIGEGVQTQIYLSVILWAVAALAAFRFVGAVAYLLLRLMGR